MRNAWLIAIFASVSLYTSAQKTVYVSPSGNDSWTGEQHKPFKSLHRALEENQKCPDTLFIQVASGDYLLDKPLDLSAREGEDLSVAECFAPTLHQWIIAKGNREALLKDIRFENLSFQYAAYSMPKFGNEPMQAAATVEAAVELEYVKNIRFVNCEMLHTGGYAVWLKTACSDKFSEWKKLKERHSVEMDPGFKDAVNDDFRFASMKAARKIHFKPFDLTEVGVYGSSEWKEKARMPEESLVKSRVLTRYFHNK